MPLVRYFAGVGSFLLAALFAANWLCPAPLASTVQSDVPLDQKITIRIHTDHKWPERVVFDMSRSMLPSGGKVDPENHIAGNQRAPAFDAFAEMVASPGRPCFRRPCLDGQPRLGTSGQLENDAPPKTRPRR
jgi:hypothetical protein